MENCIEMESVAAQVKEPKKDTFMRAQTGRKILPHNLKSQDCSRSTGSIRDAKQHSSCLKIALDLSHRYSLHIS